jgi:hypothetical protein
MTTSALIASDEVPIQFCSLGMFIIDDIQFEASDKVVSDLIGGAGAYAAIGARLLSPPPLTRSVGWIVDAGSDFPESFRKVINELDTACVLRETPDRLTTRGWNVYGEGEYRCESS